MVKKILILFILVSITIPNESFPDVSAAGSNPVSSNTVLNGAPNASVSSDASATISENDDPCTRHQRTGTKKTIVRLYDSRDSRNSIDQLQPAIWEEVKRYFSDFKSISFVEVDVSVCPQVTVDFPVKKYPAYGMMRDSAIIYLCNAPDTFEKVWNFFFDAAPKSYKKQKGFKMYTLDICNITYPRMKGQELTEYYHDYSVNSKRNIVLYYDKNCRYCKQFIGIWNSIYNDLKEYFRFLKIDCLNIRQFCAQRGAFGYPSLFFYNNGNKTEYTGNEDIAEIKQFALNNKI